MSAAHEIIEICPRVKFTQTVGTVLGSLVYVAVHPPATGFSSGSIPYTL